MKSNEKEEKYASENETVHRKTFTWEAINYVVPVPGGQARLLHDVYGYVKPGTLVRIAAAVWCASVANVLSCRPPLWAHQEPGRPHA